MTKSDLIEIVAKKAHLTKKATREVIDTFLDEVAKALKSGQKVVVSRFGTFYVSHRSDKEVVPFGQEEKRKVIKAHHAVNFRVSSPLKKLVK